MGNDKNRYSSRRRLCPLQSRWMSALEAAAQPIVAPMVEGAHMILDVTAQLR
jgi:hypothetical protein